MTLPKPLPHLAQFQTSILTKVRISKSPQQICHSSESWNLLALNSITFDEGQDFQITPANLSAKAGTSQ